MIIKGNDESEVLSQTPPMYNQSNQSPHHKDLGGRGLENSSEEQTLPMDFFSMNITIKIYFFKF